MQNKPVVWYEYVNGQRKLMRDYTHETWQKLYIQKPKHVFCKVVGGKLSIGSKSQHRTLASRHYRLIIRLKVNRLNRE